MSQLLRFVRTAPIVLALLLLAGVSLAMQTVDKKASQSSVDSTISSWKPEPQKTARTIIAKYGLPHEVAPNRLIWHRNGRQPGKPSSGLVNPDISVDAGGKT